MSIQDGMETRTLQRKSLSVCPKCNEKCLKEEGEIVRAFNHVYHYKCFICEVNNNNDNIGENQGE